MSKDRLPSNSFASFKRIRKNLAKINKKYLESVSISSVMRIRNGPEQLRDQNVRGSLKGSYDAFLKIIIWCIWCNRIC